MILSWLRLTADRPIQHFVSLTPGHCGRVASLQAGRGPRGYKSWGIGDRPSTRYARAWFVYDGMVRLRWYGSFTRVPYKVRWALPYARFSSKSHKARCSGHGDWLNYSFELVSVLYREYRTQNTLNRKDHLGSNQYMRALQNARSIAVATSLSLASVPGLLVVRPT